MNEFEARNSRQLGICLRLLYAENVQFTVRIAETEKRKIVFRINVKTDDETYEALREKFRILIS